ncbi:hypothetical protein Hanom_Chr13g01219441 [Helianthus anomalus]
MVRNRRGRILLVIHNHHRRGKENVIQKKGKKRPGRCGGHCGAFFGHSMLTTGGWSKSKKVDREIERERGSTRSKPLICVMVIDVLDSPSSLSCNKTCKKSLFSAQSIFLLSSMILSNIPSIFFIDTFILFSIPCTSNQAKPG